MDVSYRHMGPWYFAEPTGLRRLWQDVLVRVGYLSAERLPGKSYKSQGYRLEELVRFRHKSFGVTS